MSMKVPSFYPNRLFIQPISEQPAHKPYVPRPSRDPYEIARRRAAKRGSLILRQQNDGLVVVRDGLRLATNFIDVAQWADCVAPGIIGSARYHLNSPDNIRQVRYVPLPKLAVPGQRRPHSDQQFEKAQAAIEESVAAAYSLRVSHACSIGSSAYEKLELKAGKLFANSAFLLATVATAETTAFLERDISGNAIQTIVMQECKQLITTAGDIRGEVGAYPTAAQLADPISPLAVEIRRAGPDRGATIYERVAA